MLLNNLAKVNMMSVRMAQLKRHHNVMVSCLLILLHLASLDLVNTSSTVDTDTNRVPVACGLLTFAILPGCVPRQAEKRREENDRSGNRSMSEPHLISAILATTRGDPGAAVLLSLPSGCRAGRRSVHRVGYQSAVVDRTGKRK